MTIGVTGSTGQLGRLTIDRLKQIVPGDQIVALARTPEKAADLGVAVRPFDYAQAEGLADALSGIDTLLLISSSEVGQRAVQHRNVIDAAKAAGVTRIVYTSLLHADTSPLSLADEHRATEQLLAASGIAHNILRNGWYHENYTGSIPGAVAAGAFIGSAGSGRIASASRADYAAAAAAVLAAPDGHPPLYELAGDSAYTLADLAAEISRQSGKDIPYHNLSQDDYAAALVGVGLPEPLAQAIAGWDVGASQDALFDDGGALSRLIGRPTTPIVDAVAQALAA